MWPASSKIPGRETSTQSLYSLLYWHIQFMSEGDLSIFVLQNLNDLIVCLFSVRHLGEWWSHDSPFCVNITPGHIFGNVQPKKWCAYKHIKHKHTFYNTLIKHLSILQMWLLSLHVPVWVCVCRTISTDTFRSHITPRKWSNLWSSETSTFFY